MGLGKVWDAFTPLHRDSGRSTKSSSALVRVQQHIWYSHTLRVPSLYWESNTYSMNGLSTLCTLSQVVITSVCLVYLFSFLRVSNQCVCVWWFFFLLPCPVRFSLSFYFFPRFFFLLILSYLASHCRITMNLQWSMSRSCRSFMLINADALQQSGIGEMIACWILTFCLLFCA